MTAPDIRALLDAEAERAGKVEALAGAATEGPWEAFGRVVVAHTSPRCNCATPDARMYGHESHCGLEPLAEAHGPDAEFIAASRTETPWLVERLRARDEAIRAVLFVHRPNIPEWDDAFCLGCYDGGGVEATPWRDCPTVAALASALGGGEQQ